MRKRLLLLFVVMLLFFAMLGHNVTLILSDKLSEISTVEMSAAVAGVSPNAEGDYMISLKEPDGQLRIPAAIARNMDVAEIAALQQGTRLSFRIPISQIDYFPETQAGTIVALKTDHELLSIEDYNRSMHEDPFGIIDLFDTSRSEDAGGAAETDIRKIKICRRYVF